MEREGGTEACFEFELTSVQTVFRRNIEAFPLKLMVRGVGPVRATFRKG